MKSIVKLMALAIAAVTIVACANNDLNPITPDGGKAVVTVKTAALYEQLGITDEMNEFLADVGNYIYTTVLFYDQQGSLKGKFTGQTHSLKPLEVPISGLADGTYTLLAVQTGAKGEPQWTLTNEGSLNDVEMTIPDPTLLPPYMSLGTATQTVAVKDGAIQAEVSAEALGAIIEAQAKGLTKEDNVSRLMLTNWIVLNGIYLGPNRTGSDRLDVADYDGRVLNILGDKDGAVIEGDVSWKNFSLYCVDDDVLLTLIQYKPDSDEIIQWGQGGTTLKPGGRYVIFMDNDGNQLKQLYCGTYEGLDAWLKKRAENPYALNPCLKFGASVEEVRQHVAANEVSWVDYGISYYDEMNLWVDDYAIGANSISYLYDSEDGKSMKGVIYIHDGSVSYEVMQHELEKMGYTYKGIIKYPMYPDVKFLMYLSEDGETEVQIVLNSAHTWQVSFQPTDYTDFEYLVAE